MKTFLVTAEVTVRVAVGDQSVIDRCVNDEDGWRTRMFYPLDTEAKVIEHLAYNAIANHLHNLGSLDGWADLPMDSATMEVDGVEFLTVAESAS